ncbi:MAG: hypothetical protein RLZZ584_2305 [Pseudomonadota bacterium]|jgi:hypothetical protein
MARDVYPVMSLSRYRELLAHAPLPTEAQMVAFAAFVSTSHSWYKHLPLVPPGVPFQFHLDPRAGMQWVQHPDGSIEVAHRREQGFHYSWIPTDEYRKRFGLLTYSRGGIGTSVSMRSPEGISLIASDDAPLIPDVAAASLPQIPVEVAQAGRAHVSGIVHHHTMFQLLLRELSYFQQVDWPAESGGDAALRQITERCQALWDNPDCTVRLRHPDPRLRGNSHLYGVDFPLHELLEPERQRQRRGMVAAMQRVVALLAATK